MRLRRFVIPQCAFVLSALVAFGQATSDLTGPQEVVSTKPLPGVLVEEVGKNAETGKSEFQKGDLLLRWSGNDAKGEIRSPFDLRELLIEQAPRGTIRIDGVRGDQAQTWILEPSTSPIRSRPNLPESVLTIYQQGQQLAQAGKLIQAAERWRAAALEAYKTGSPWLSAWLLSNAAERLAGTQQWQQADDLYREAIEQADGAGLLMMALLLEDWAKTFDDRKDSVDAEKYHEQALAVQRKFGTETTIMASLILGRLGWAAWRRSDLTKAEECFSQALAIQEKLAPGSPYVAATLVNLGSLSDRRGDSAKAEEYDRRALAISSGRPNSQPAILNNLGSLAYNRGDLVTAERYYRQVVAMGQGSYSLVLPFSNLGAIERERGDLMSAERYFGQALTIQEKRAADSIETARILTRLGEVVADQGHLAKAEDYQRHALAIAEKLFPGSRDVARILSDLGSVTAKQGDLIEAESYHQRALEIYKAQGINPQAAVVLDRLGDLFRERGDLAKADEYYRQALAILEKMNPGSKDHAETLAALAGLMQQKQQPDAAAQFYQQALDVLESQIARLGGGDEDHSRFRALHSGYYTKYVELLIAGKQPDRAFEVLERSRARTLLEILTAAQVNIRQGVDATLLGREHSLRDSVAAKSNRRLELLGTKPTEEQITVLDKQIKELLAQLDDVEAQIRLNSPVYAALTQPQPLSLKEIQERLLNDKDTLLLEYSLGEEHSYLFVVSSTSLVVHQLPKRATIEQTARRAYELLTQWSNQKGEAQTALAEQEYAKAAVRLSQMLLAPAASQLRGNRLLIVGDGVLHSVPFASLPSPGNSAVPLMVRHEIVNLPSASVLAVLRQEAMGRKLAPRAVAVLADPVFDREDVRVKNPAAKQDRVQTVRLTRGTGADEKGAGEGETYDEIEAEPLTRSVADMNAAAGGAVYLPRLQLTRQEARNILNATPAGEGMQALDFRASRATMMSPALAQYRIVHLATHGLVNSKHPELSGLVLSLVDEQGTRQNGFLGLEDIYNLNLPVELVVLSACETGLGQTVQGEGLIGLTRGFMYAGATRVVASLWKIDDLATAELMARFYREMEQQKMRPAAALRAAQVSMWKQKRWRSPYYWAAFQIHGEWK
jgi:CHAT domain-containing protein/Tfp pilus assembly protein PilF